MSYVRKIAHLEETHAMLKRELEEAKEGNASDAVIQQLKKKKLHVKDLIEHLRNEEGKEFK